MSSRDQLAAALLDRRRGALSVAVSDAVATRWSRALGFAERRLPALTRLKKKETLPIRLDRRRIYVVPSRFGLLFSVILIVMLLGALNYNNNPAILLTCLLAAASYQSIFQSFRTLNGVQLVAIQAQPCHAGGVDAAFSTFPH